MPGYDWHTVPHPEVRLAPLDDAELYARRRDKKLPAVCPCCNGQTDNGWLFELGCCWACSTVLDRPAPVPVPAAPDTDPWVSLFGRNPFTGATA